MKKRLLLVMLALFISSGCRTPVEMPDITEEDQANELTATPTPAATTWDISAGMLLPAPKDGEEVINHKHYSLVYSEEDEQARWVAYELTAEEASGGLERSGNFKVDPLIATGSAKPSDYTGSGYDRGHLAPAADMSFSETALKESFYMSNVSPQAPSFNRGKWKELEGEVRAAAIEWGAAYIVTGPVLDGQKLGIIGASEVTVPKRFYKIVFDFKEPGIKMLAFVMPNEKCDKAIEEYMVSVDEVESITGIDFFPGLPDELEARLEAEKAGEW